MVDKKAPCLDVGEPNSLSFEAGLKGTHNATQFEGLKTVPGRSGCTKFHELSCG